MKRGHQILYHGLLLFTEGKKKSCTLTPVCVHCAQAVESGLQGLAL
jgi:hypothetical protein